MEINFYRVWLPVSLALHLLLLPVLAVVRIYIPLGNASDTITIITPVDEKPTAPPTPPRAEIRKPVAVRSHKAPQRAASRPAPSSPPRAVEATLNVKAQAMSDLSGLRQGFGGGRLPGPPTSIQHGTPLSPDNAGGTPARMAAPHTGPLSAFGTPGGLNQDVATLPNASSSVMTSDRGSWAAAPGAADGSGRAPAGLGGKRGPNDGAMPDGGQTSIVTRGGARGPIASAPTSARADIVLPGGSDGPIRPGGGSGLDRDVRALPGSGAITVGRGDWSSRPGDADGTGRAPTGMVKRGPSTTEGGGDGGTIIAAGRSTGPGPGGAGGGPIRSNIAGSGERIGPGTGGGNIDRDVRGLPGANGAGRGDWRETAGGTPGGTGAGDGNRGDGPGHGGDGHGGPSYGVSSGDGIAVGYPTLAAMEGLEGTVVVSVQVGANGDVTKAVATTRSAYDSLDNAAIRTARIWPFRPAVQNGEPVAGTAKLKFTFVKVGKDFKVVVTQL